MSSTDSEINGTTAPQNTSLTPNPTVQRALTPSIQTERTLDELLAITGQRTLEDLLALMADRTLEDVLALTSVLLSPDNVHWRDVNASRHPYVFEDWRNFVWWKIADVLDTFDYGVPYSDEVWAYIPGLYLRIGRLYDATEEHEFPEHLRPFAMYNAFVAKNWEKHVLRMKRLTSLESAVARGETLTFNEKREKLLILWADKRFCRLALFLRYINTNVDLYPHWRRYVAVQLYGDARKTPGLPSDLTFVSTTGAQTVALWSPAIHIALNARVIATVRVPRVPTEVQRFPDHHHDEPMIMVDVPTPGDMRCVETISEYSGEDECPICMENLLDASAAAIDSDAKDASAVARLTKCGHVFHRVCIASWMTGKKTCPVCRTRLELDD